MKTNNQIRKLLHPDWHLLPFGEKKKEVEFIKKSIANSKNKQRYGKV